MKGRVLVGYALMSVFAGILLGGTGLFAYTTLEAARIGRAFPAQGRFVAVPGGRLHYTERMPSGPVRAVVVLLHGASGNQADLMVPLGDKLAARGFRVLAFDRPGHGWSDRPDGERDATPDRQAVLIGDALDRLGVEHAIVLGHSWAGALAVAFALDQPKRTVGLVLVSPVTHPWPTGIAWYYGPASSSWLGPLFTHTLTLPIGAALLPAAIDEVLAPNPTPERFADRSGVSLVLRPTDFQANAQDVFHLLDFVRHQAPRMGSIVAPTAIVTGDSDHVVLTHIHAFQSAQVISGATLTILPGVGHSPHWVRPDAIVDAVEGVAHRIHADPTAFP